MIGPVWLGELRVLCGARNVRKLKQGPRSSDLNVRNVRVTLQVTAFQVVATNSVLDFPTFGVNDLVLRCGDQCGTLLDEHASWADRRGHYLARSHQPGSERLNRKLILLLACPRPTCGHHTAQSCDGKLPIRARYPDTRLCPGA